MRKASAPEFHAAKDFPTVQSSASSVLLRSKAMAAEIRVLADDLFRLRIARGNFSRRPSWAVCKTDWQRITANIRESAKGISIKTCRAQLVFSTATGQWKFEDSSGNTLFNAAAGASGFAGAEARLSLRLADGESLFGLGETTSTFNKRGLIREFWNIDVLGHAPAIHPSLRSLYVSIPFAISLRGGRAAGLFWDNPARQTWDLGQTRLDQWQMRAASGEIDLYLFAGPSVETVVERFTELTGRMPLPPRWALGYHQCRYSYETRQRVEQVARDFRRRKIPCDALYLDIHHMDGYRVFTFGKSFPKPAQLMRRLAKRGFKVVTIVDPGVKDDRKFGVLKRGKKLSAFVKEPNGKRDYVGRVWPGKARFPDFLNKRVREWWGREQGRLTRLGVAGFWNDMNEPANFALPIKTLLPDCRHDTDYGPMRQAEAHNVYGMQMARASRDGALRSMPDARPFVITRAGYAGVQRHAMVWTGDNSSVWEHLADAVQMYLNLSISGVPFCGGDVGGFLDNTTPELLVRWMQMAAFTPFFRNHSNIETINQEPWAFGADTETICRRYIELRYQLLSYLYCLFAEAHRTGAPIMRPLFWHYQDDPVAVATGDQFLLGANLLVAPVMLQGAAVRSVYLPRGRWFDFWTGEAHQGGQHILADAPLEKLPLFVRAGAIIPMAAVRQFIDEKPDTLINLQVWPGAKGTLDWREDDGHSMNYTSGAFLERKVSSALNVRGAGTIRFARAQGEFRSPVKKWRLVLRGATRSLRATVNGKPVSGRFDRHIGICALEFRNDSEPMDVVLR